MATELLNDSSFTHIRHLVSGRPRQRASMVGAQSCRGSERDPGLTSADPKPAKRATEQTVSRISKVAASTASAIADGTDLAFQEGFGWLDYRAEVDCIMFSRTDFFCKVCKRAIERVIRLYA